MVKKEEQTGCLQAGKKKNDGKKPLGLYVHIPFCKKKCGYCDFLSFPDQEEAWADYTLALCQEIQSFSEKKEDLAERYEVSTLFWGGGTPSILPSFYIEEILEAIKEVFPLAEKKEMEITLEANPGTLTREKLEAYQRAGINRLSLGLQSADEGELRLLGRIHSYEDFLKGFTMAREAGFTNINVDIMSALPGQKRETLEETLWKTAKLSPEHFSVYSLILEEGTPFYSQYEPHPELLASEEEERDMYARTREILGQYGYERYEISNYAKKGFACKHNLSYWDGTDYIGLGLGAASLFENRRFSRERDLGLYLSQCKAAAGKGYEAMERAITRGMETLTEQDKMEEFMFLGLRRGNGVSKKEFYRRFGRHMEAVYGDTILKYLEGGFLCEEGERLKLTVRGIDVSNVVMADFLL